MRISIFFLLKKRRNLEKINLITIFLFIPENINNKRNISESWLINKYNNCRYNAFISLFYFTISPFIYNIVNENIKDLKELNELIIRLSKDVNDKNYNEIVIFK